jgi:hypothetical protein
MDGRRRGCLRSLVTRVSALNTREAGFIPGPQASPAEFLKVFVTPARWGGIEQAAEVLWRWDHHAPMARQPCP